MASFNATPPWSAPTAMRSVTAAEGTPEAAFAAPSPALSFTLLPPAAPTGTGFPPVRTFPRSPASPGNAIPLACARSIALGVTAASRTSSAAMPSAIAFRTSRSVTTRRRAINQSHPSSVDSRQKSAVRQSATTLTGGRACAGYPPVDRPAAVYPGGTVSDGLEVLAFRAAAAYSLYVCLARQATRAAARTCTRGSSPSYCSSSRR